MLAKLFSLDPTIQRNHFEVREEFKERIYWDSTVGIHKTSVKLILLALTYCMILTADCLCGVVEKSMMWGRN